MELIIAFADTFKLDALAVLCARRAEAFEAQTRRARFPQAQKEKLNRALVDWRSADIGGFGSSTRFNWSSH